MKLEKIDYTQLIYSEFSEINNQFTSYETRSSRPVTTYSGEKLPAEKEGYKKIDVNCYTQSNAYGLTTTLVPSDWEIIGYGRDRLFRVVQATPSEREIMPVLNKLISAGVTDVGSAGVASCWDLFALIKKATEKNPMGLWGEKIAQPLIEAIEYIAGDSEHFRIQVQPTDENVRFLYFISTFGKFNPNKKIVFDFHLAGAERMWMCFSRYTFSNPYIEKYIARFSHAQKVLSTRSQEIFKTTSTPLSREGIDLIHSLLLAYYYMY